MSQRTIAVIDGNSLIHRAFHALPETMTAPDGRPTNAAFGFVSMLVKMIQELRPDGVVAAFDAGKPAFRMEALEQYKMHRPPTPSALKEQFPMVHHLLEALDVPIVQVEGWEADDLLGTLARRGETEGLRVLLVTGDRDVFQLVSESVQVVTTKKGLTDIAVYGPAEVEARYGVTPQQVPDYLGLKGDTSDNIPGVPGIGEKTAAKLLQEHGSLEAVLEAAAEMPGKVGENLREHSGEALASRTVATIACDVPVEIDLGWGGVRAVRSGRGRRGVRRTAVHVAARARARAGGHARAGLGHRGADSRRAFAGTGAARRAGRWRRGRDRRPDRSHRVRACGALRSRHWRRRDGCGRRVDLRGRGLAWRGARGGRRVAVRHARRLRGLDRRRRRRGASGCRRERAGRAAPRVPGRRRRREARA